MPPESVPLSSATTFDRGSPPTRDRESLSTTYFIAPAEPPGGKAAPEKKYTASAHRAAPAALPAQPKRAPGPPLGLGHRRPPHDHSADQGSAPHPQHTHRAAWGARDSRGGPGTTTLARTGQWRQGQHQLNSSNIFDLGRAHGGCARGPEQGGARAQGGGQRRKISGQSGQGGSSSAHRDQRGGQGAQGRARRRRCTNAAERIAKAAAEAAKAAARNQADPSSAQAKTATAPAAAGAEAPDVGGAAVTAAAAPPAAPADAVEFAVDGGGRAAA